VVEDVFEGDASCNSARQVVSDWLLKKLYREADYAAAVPSGSWRAIDLTAGVRSSSRLAIFARSAALRAALPWAGPSRAAALRAFRGGLHLERLYAAGVMRYVAMFWSKQDAGPR
jgi:hypothetical protein